MSDNLKKRHCFDESFKHKTVQRLLESGKPVSVFAHEAGVEQSILHRWVKKYREDGRSPSTLQDAEVKALKKEVAELKVTVRVLQRIVEKSFADRYGFEYTGSVVSSENSV